jgi:hypothetical protein
MSALFHASNREGRTGSVLGQCGSPRGLARQRRRHNSESQFCLPGALTDHRSRRGGADNAVSRRGRVITTAELSGAPTCATLQRFLHPYSWPAAQWAVDLASWNCRLFAVRLNHC